MKNSQANQRCRHNSRSSKWGCEALINDLIVRTLFALMAPRSKAVRLCRTLVNPCAADYENPLLCIRLSLQSKTMSHPSIPLPEQKAVICKSLGGSKYRGKKRSLCSIWGVVSWQGSPLYIGPTIVVRGFKGKHSYWARDNLRVV